MINYPILTQILASEEKTIKINGKPMTLTEFENSKGLVVKGDLYLNNTSITSLPKDLRVSGDLYLEGTKITSLPKDLKVADFIFLSKDSPIKQEEMPPVLRKKIVRWDI